jgi:pseudouridine 5'-phosphatase
MNRLITHVIFDVDGLLLDTEPFYTEAHQMVAARYGKVFDWTIKSRMIGLPAQSSAQVAINTMQLPMTVAEYLEARRRLLEELFPKTEPMPGAVRLTRRFRQIGIPQAIATSSDRHHFELKITKHKEWFRIFQSFVMGDDPEIKRGKPAPDIFLLAAKRLQAPPAQCLIFEDSPAGVEAARAAGMFAIAVPDPHMDDKAYPNAHQIIRNLNDFDFVYWGFPPCG